MFKLGPSCWGQVTKLPFPADQLGGQDDVLGEGAETGNSCGSWSLVPSSVMEATPLRPLGGVLLFLSFTVNSSVLVGR